MLEVGYTKPRRIEVSNNACNNYFSRAVSTSSVCLMREHTAPANHNHPSHCGTCAASRMCSSSRKQPRYLLLTYNTGKII